LVIPYSTLHTWTTIAAVVVTATAGDISIARSMRSLDLDAIRAKSGLGGAILAVVTKPTLIFGIFCMALSFFSLLSSLSGADLSLVAPATASLTSVTTALAAKVFLKENVDRRRWLAAVFVCAGVALLAR